MSQVSIRVMNDQFNEPISEAAVYLIDDSGKIISLLGYSDPDGWFYGDVAEGADIKISYPGYIPIVIKGMSSLSDPITISLTPAKTSELENVIVKSVKKKVVTLTHPDNYTLPVVLGSLALVTFGIWLYKVSV